MQQKPAELRLPERRKKVKSFSQATCAAEKIPLGLANARAVRQRRTARALQQAANPFVKKGILFDSDNPAGSCPRSVGSACPKASQSFAAAAAKESQIIFSGDMCG
ncbi:MAG: hypothetical protein ACLUNO_08695 [Oscillospiraceae bacterium]